MITTLFYVTLGNYKLFAFNELKNPCVSPPPSLQKIMQNYLYIYIYNIIHYNLFIIICAYTTIHVIKE